MKKVTGMEKFAYSMGAFGQNFVYGLMSTYLLIFYTDSVGLAAAAVGTLFLVARIWDAVMDPIIGFIIDKVNTRFGKFRPFILVGGVLAGIMTILCFVNPHTGLTGKMVYAYFTYIIWGTTYGIMDVPYWSMAPSMSVDPAERTKIVSLPKITGTISTILVSVFTIPMVQAFGHGDSSKGYFFTALIFGLLCAAGASFAAAKTKEHIKIEPKKNEKFIESVNVIAKNYPLLLVLLMTLFTSCCLTIKLNIYTYYFKYNIGNENLIPFFSALTILPMILAMVFVTPISKKFGKKATSIAAGIVAAVPSIAIYYSIGSLPLVFIFNAVSMMGIGMMLVLTMSMQADTVEYAEWKTGKRSESIIFSLGTFTTKLASALGGAITGYWLTIVGYEKNVQQTATALGGINAMMSWAPAVGMLLMAVIVIFYNLSEEKHAEIMNELQQRHSAAINASKLQQGHSTTSKAEV